MRVLWKVALGVLAGSALVAACSSRSATTPPAGAASAPGYHPGKFVWHDLVTPDPASSQRFYESLLGWEFESTTRSGRPYAVARVGGHPVAGIVVHPDPGDDPALWLSYLSVPDVDAAVAEVTAAGGKTLYAPTDLADAARVAVVSDPQGAALGLARLLGGDPDDPPQPRRQHFFWMEYLAEDASKATEFYKGIIGYQVSEDDRSAGPDYFILRRDGRSRAGLFQIPPGHEKLKPNWLPYVLVDDPTALAARVAGLGGSVILPPRQEIRSGSLAIVADPAGGALALQRWPL